jgi:hypothetical protein
MPSPPLSSLKKHRPLCPWLPVDPRKLSFRNLREASPTAAPDTLNTITTLAYANQLWVDGLPARAVLTLAKVLYAGPTVDESAENALAAAFPRRPYAAMSWMFRRWATDPELFWGNPRLSFEHQATRRKPDPDSTLFVTRAWAVCALLQTHRPDIPGDPAIPQKQLDIPAIHNELNRHADPAEATLFQQALDPGIVEMK